MATLLCSRGSHRFLPEGRCARLLWRFVLICLLGVTLWLVVSPPAQALPAFARQTGQSCVACHAGGQFPELTPYGRMFKLTGYTFGEHANPVSAMVVADWTANRSEEHTSELQSPLK